MAVVSLYIEYLLINGGIYTPILNDAIGQRNMSRSYKHTPIFHNVGTKAGTMKWWRRTCYKAERAYWRANISRCQVEVDTLRYQDSKYWHNPWTSVGDGKYYWAKPINDKDWVLELWTKIMRK